MTETLSTTVVYNIDVRVRLLLAHITHDKNDWKLLERATGVAAEKWRQYGRGSTSASTAMLSALGQTWPQYAFWLVTGVSDELHGHHAPNAALAFPNLTPGTAYENPRVVEHGDFEKTILYFQSAGKLAAKLFPFTKPNDVRLEGDLILLAKRLELKEKEFVFNCQRQLQKAD